MCLRGVWGGERTPPFPLSQRSPGVRYQQRLMANVGDYQALAARSLARGLASGGAALSLAREQQQNNRKLHQQTNLT